MKRVVLCVLVFFLASPAAADVAFQFAALGARVPDDPNVDGFRLSLLYGKAAKMSGLDLGFASISEAKNRSGLSAIFGVSTTTGSSSGCNAGLVVLNSGESTGINAAFINRVKTIKEGANVGFLNLTEGFSSVDISGLGISDRSNIQVGFVNITKKIEGIQIGFLNVAENGFFPIFPFFNFPKK